jgi:hypothetical protein
MEDQLQPVPSFNTLKEANEWMENKVDDPCIDNYRFAYDGDEEASKNYDEVQRHGCCGSFDRRVMVAGRLATIGCNYGH